MDKTDSTRSEPEVDTKLMTGGLLAASFVCLIQIVAVEKPGWSLMIAACCFSFVLPVLTLAVLYPKGFAKGRLAGVYNGIVPVALLVAVVGIAACLFHISKITGLIFSLTAFLSLLVANKHEDSRLAKTKQKDEGV